MNISKLLKNKKVVSAVAGGVVVLGLTGGGVYLVQKKSNEMNVNQSQTNQSNQNSNSDTSTQDTAANLEGKANSGKSNPSQDNTQTVPVSANLDDVTLQGDIFDKNTGDISVTLYGGPGKYTVDKQINGNWVNVATNLDYIGRGGLSLNDTIPISELSRVYRVYRTTDGTKNGPKEITVDRNLINSNGGSASFPKVGAL